MQSLPPALQPLAAYRQFIAYKLVPSATRPGKVDKVPIHPTMGHKVDLTDPSEYVTFDQVTAGDGKGFVFTEDDPFFFLDIDDCLQPDGQWAPIVHELCGKFAGAAVEVSQSGRGLHIFGTGAAPRPRKCKAKGFDLYTEGRFVALTGTHAQGSAATCHEAALVALVGEYLALEAGEGHEDGWWSEEPVEGWTGYTDDDELLAVAMRSASAASAFGGRASFADLWHADEAKLAACYPPDQGGESYDASAVDAALAQHLAFHTGNNAERMLALMERSALKREKWERPDYLPRTIRKACAQQRDVFHRREMQSMEVASYEQTAVEEKRAEGEALQVRKPEAVRVTGNTYLAADDQIKLFKGCCYVSEIDKILSPEGYLYGSSQFNSIYGGYTFVMDAQGERTVRKAWECYTESQVVRFPRTRGVCFKPNLPPGAVIQDGGRDRVNTYVPISVARVAGDVQPFLDHLAKMLPNEQDRMTLLGYMAGCVQYQGVKFQWAPLIQGVEGNGKTLLALCVAEAVGARYVHWPMAKDIDNIFNKWLWGNIFYAVDEIMIEDTRTSVLETLKPMITANRGGIQITGKGVDQTNQDICGNFMFLTNHRNAVHLKSNERRVAPFFTAQQRKADLVRDGMDAAYFARLIAWFESGGYAKVAEYLHTWPIPRHVDPRFMSRKPMTTTTGEAVEAGLDGYAQRIVDQVEQGTTGFAGGWISSTALGRLFDGRLSPARYKAILEELGYEQHPGLTGGRTNSPLPLEGGSKPRLYVTAGHYSLTLVGAKEITEAYVAAQSGLGIDS